MYDVISIGGATRDIFFSIDAIKGVKDKRSDDLCLKIPYGEKLLSDETFYHYGGGAVNSSVCFTRLGARAAALCSIGKEGSGTLVYDYLRKEKVATHLVHRDPALHTGLSIMIVGRDGEHASFLERGANDHLLIGKLAPLKKTKWFYISSLTGHADHMLSALFDFAVHNGIKIAFNPGSEQLAEGFMGLADKIKMADILILNSEEAEALVFSKNGRKPKDEVALLREVEKMGAKISVVTDDGDGAHAASEGKKYHVRAFSSKVVDTTGAGDSFGATFTFGIMKGLDVNLSLKMAAINAASVVSKMGAQDGLLTYNGVRNSKWF